MGLVAEQFALGKAAAPGSGVSYLSTDNPEEEVWLLEANWKSFHPNFWLFGFPLLWTLQSERK